MEYKDTINLPKTSFPMKADLPKREPQFLEYWEKIKVYQEAQKIRGKAPVFILHDGPPYANGDIHMGHALNKILKDVIVRYKTMKGFRSPYVPGWDCHGLPVELQLFKELKQNKHSVDRLEFREKARGYALKYVGIQREQFKRLGVWGDWENPYLTMNYDYQSTIMESFWELYRKQYIYKGEKPIHWCASCETALAEAEVEYENKSSPSIYVKFQLTSESCKKLDFPDPSFILIWTTTPWTLPGNVAIALRPEADYSLIQVNEDKMIVASDLVAQLQAVLGLKDIPVLKVVKGKSFEYLECEHPFMNRKTVLILGDHVTMDQGTGCVHTAPGHGQEDYEIGLKYKLPILSPVNSKGEFTEEVEFLKGQFVFKANKMVCELLKEKGVLLFKNEIEHSYPHCWRCKNPIIFRATQQWFIGVDRQDLRKNAIQAIEKVKWIPEVGKNRISSMVELRPDWCLSRQRLWGVPIPIFYCEHCEHEFLDEETAKSVIEKVKKEGASVWFRLSAKELIPDGKKCPSCGGEHFSKEEDILDVWFDSGVSHQAVLNKNKNLAFPADLYLEGSDQHRGWFQTSLLASIGLCQQAPFKSVLTHGFVVDGDGKKMSKSEGNVIAPQEVMKHFGADILRLWVASSDFSQDVRISNDILAQIADSYRKMRNSFRYILGNLYDYEATRHKVEEEHLESIDRWALSRLSQIYKAVNQAYEEYEFCKIYHLIDQFCTVDLSSFYFDILKDRLYTSPALSKKRKAAQSVLYEILRVLSGILAPILPFTTEEIWLEYNGGEEKNSSVHLSLWPELDVQWYDPKLDEKWELIKKIRSDVLKVLESLRKEKVIGSALEAEVKILTNDLELFHRLEEVQEDLRYIFIVSKARVEKMDQPWPKECHVSEYVKGLGIIVQKAEGLKCQRCWNYSVYVGKNEDHPTLCERCVKSVQEILMNCN